MLVLRRREGERIKIGDDIEIVIVRSGKTVEVGIDAPRDVKILRSELLDKSRTRVGARMPRL